MIAKISHIIISVLLLIATTGFTTYKNYCGEDLMAKGFQTDQVDCCDMASCCHEDAETLKIDAEYLSVSFDYNFENIVVKISTLLDPVFNNSDIGTNSIALFDSSKSLYTKHKVRSYLQVFLL